MAIEIANLVEALAYLWLTNPIDVDNLGLLGGDGVQRVERMGAGIYEVVLDQPLLGTEVPAGATPNAAAFVTCAQQNIGYMVTATILDAPNQDRVQLRVYSDAGVLSDNVVCALLVARFPTQS